MCSGSSRLRSWTHLGSCLIWATYVTSGSISRVKNVVGAKCGPELGLIWVMGLFCGPDIIRIPPHTWHLPHIRWTCGWVKNTRQNQMFPNGNCKYEPHLDKPLLPCGRSLRAGWTHLENIQKYSHLKDEADAKCRSNGDLSKSVFSPVNYQKICTSVELFLNRRRIFKPWYFPWCWYSPLVIGQS